jgi:spore maturation protein CgeB
LARIRHYLDHEAERAAIAAAGQRRTLNDHNYFKRTGEILELIAEFR